MKNIKLIFCTALFSVLVSCTAMENLFHDDEENEREIDVSALPAAVTSAINESYAGALLLEADEITQTDGSLTYDVEIKYEGNVIEVMYDAAGNFLGIEEDDADDDGEEDDD